MQCLYQKLYESFPIVAQQRIFPGTVVWEISLLRKVSECCTVLGQRVPRPSNASLRRRGVHHIESDSPGRFSVFHKRSQSAFVIDGNSIQIVGQHLPAHGVDQVCVVGNHGFIIQTLPSLRRPDLGPWLAGIGKGQRIKIQSGVIAENHIKKVPIELGLDPGIFFRCASGFQHSVMLTGRSGIEHLYEGETLCRRGSAGIFALLGL